MFSQGDHSIQDIGIIGGGHAAICSAIRLMRHARGHMNIYMIEKGAMGGVAYSTESADEYHHLNLQAGRISILREDPKHFMRWAKQKKNLEMNPSSPVSRQLFGEYCWDTLWDEANKCPLANLKVCQGNVTSFNESTDGVRLIKEEDVKLRMSLDLFKKQDAGLVEKVLRRKMPMPLSVDGAGETITLPEKFDYLIAATGHLEVKKPEALKNEAENNDKLVIDQYIPSAHQTLKKASVEARAEDKILILGTGLAALDPVVSIAERRLKECKTPEERSAAIAAMPHFILCSRHAHSHPTYADDHEHRAFAVSRPAILDQKTITLEELEEKLPKIWEKACAEMMQQDGPAIIKNEKLINERIMKAMEPFVIELGTKMSTQDVRAAFAKWGSLITSNRIGVVPKIGNLIDELKNAHKLEFKAGELSQFDGEKATISLWNKGQKTEQTEQIKPLLTINSIGRNFNYSKTTNRLWNKQTLDFMPHEKTGMGVAVTQDSKLLRSSGEAYNRVFCCGVMCIGDEIERNGRLGAFSQSQGPIKTRATQIASFINREISKPISEAKAYLAFVKSHPQETNPLSAFFVNQSDDFKRTISKLQKTFDLSIGRLTQHLYAEDSGQSPAKELANIERNTQNFINDIPFIAQQERLPPDKVILLQKVPHLLLEEYIMKANDRCCDTSKDPGNIKAAVSGGAVALSR